MTTTHDAPKGDPVDRAYAAYYRTFGAHAYHPNDASGIEVHDGKQYIVLRQDTDPTRPGILAVYRILNSGALKRLLRWPKEIGG